MLLHSSVLRPVTVAHIQTNFYQKHDGDIIKAAKLKEVEDELRVSVCPPSLLCFFYLILLCRFCRFLLSHHCLAGLVAKSCRWTS
jgi:hypothetical protein